MKLKVCSPYHIPIIPCNTRLTTVIPTQQLAPIIIGLLPVFMSLTISVFKPIAVIAITIKKNGGVLVDENDNYNEGRISQYYSIKL